MSTKLALKRVPFKTEELPRYLSEAFRDLEIVVNDNADALENISAKPNVTGSLGGNTALASLITALETLGLITDSTTA